MISSNLESLSNLRDNLSTYGKKLEDLPFVMQYNKRDLRKISSVSELNAQLNDRNVPVFEGIAKEGVGVAETLVAISRLVFASLRKTLLLPGETAEAERPGAIGDVAARIKPQPEEPEPLEEISEIEEIPEVRETGETRPKEEPREIPRHAEALEGITAEEIPDLEEILEVQEIPEETEIPEGLELITPPREVSPASFPEETPAVPDEIEIEIPDRFDEPTPAEVTRPGVSMKVEGEGLTFLKFEEVFISPGGHAVLPAVFLDAAGKPVRIRIRVSMEEGRE
jgi:hypothetical protein